MDNKKWTAVAVLLLLASIVSSVIFVQQRNEARQVLGESRDQITNLERRNSELSESLENQKSRLSTEMDRAEKEQETLKKTKKEMTELKSQLSERQIEIDTVRSELHQAYAEKAGLQEQLALAQETIAVKDKQLTESQDALWTLQSDTDGLRKNLAAVNETAAGLESRINDLTLERDDLGDQIKSLKAESSLYQEQMAGMEAQHEEVLKGQSEKIAALSSDLADSRKQLVDQENENAILLSKLKEANLTIIGLRDQLQEIASRLPELEDRLKQSLNEYQAVQENLTQARGREAELEARRKAMRETYEALLAGLKQQIDSQEASIEEYQEKLKITFVDRILFGFSQVRISPEGEAALNKLAGVLASVPEGRISIAGHADNIPVAKKFRYRFPSNWELSSARAAAVARHLLEAGSLEPSRIEVVGLSYYQPVAENDTETGRAKNRRVEIILMSDR